MVEQSDSSILNIEIEIDQNISTGNQLHLGEHGVRNEAIIKDGPLP